ncbi:anillin-like isoform X2 [Stegodyphus dumicola]|uniref:anillin-like isoform X2 n=1 Tax=Stegodyphus dumicola TaxID=202533 RepID=UPI0015A9670A|nr:anillin-like isoform X2 [Stegodyphus dumicola]
MELNDSFTEKLIQRTRARKDYVTELKNESPSVSCKKRPALTEELQLPDQNASNCHSKESPKRQCLSAPESNAMDIESEKENVEMSDCSMSSPVVPFHANPKTKGLAALRKNASSKPDSSNGVTSDQGSASESQEEDSKIVTLFFECEQKQCDSELEDDEENSSRSHENNENLSEKGNHCTENSNAKESMAPKTEPSFRKNVDPAELPLSARKALFEKALLGGTPKLNETAVENKLSVAQRTALFENACKVSSGQKTSLNQRVPQRFVAPKQSPIKPKYNVNALISPIKCAVASEAKMVQSSPAKNFTPSNAGSPAKTTGLLQRSAARTVSQDSFEGSPVVSSSATINLATSPNVGMHTRTVQQKLIESANNNWQQKDVVAKATEERKREISNLVNHWEKLSSGSYVENVVECHKQADLDESISCRSEACNESFENDVCLKYSGESENESDCNSDTSSAIEQTGSQSSLGSEDANSLEEHKYELPVEEPLASHLLKAVVSDMHEHQNNNLSTLPEASLSIQSSDCCSESSSYNSSENLSCNSSNSISSCDTATTKANVGTPVQGGSTSNPDVPLLYTVSFYRKQKQEARSTPVRTIVRREKIPSPPVEDTDQTELIQERIKALQEEILRQQTVISQTSQALNLCHATAEFSGSVEQVEGERLLLIATQKRQACLNEIQRLKMHGAQGENISDGTGTLTISDMQLPLKREFMAAKLEGKLNDAVHYFLCLIRHGAQVIVTQMVSTNDKVTDGALCFTNHIKLQGLPPDFSVVFEVYGLQTKKEVLPHEKKYHIKREHSKIRLTPKGKKADGKLLLPAVSSPGGPNAVRSPSFGVIGYTRFTLQNCNKRSFTLDKVHYSSPLDAVLKVKLKLHAEHKVTYKGFLTMFEDVSGFGSWHRRWCALNAQSLMYWKYPDDEHRKEPIGSIDLRQCVTNHVQSVTRDICARPNTFQMMTVRPQEKGDKDTLISWTANTLTTTKHLLSADTKEERILWCNKLNEALTSLRRWDPQALRPMESMQDKK